MRNVKILLVNHFPLEGSGSGVYTKNLAKALVSFGHQVKIIYPEHQQKEYEGFESRVILFKGPIPCIMKWTLIFRVLLPIQEVIQPIMS